MDGSGAGVVSLKVSSLHTAQPAVDVEHIFISKWDFLFSFELVLSFKNVKLDKVVPFSFE